MKTHFLYFISIALGMSGCGQKGETSATTAPEISYVSDFKPAAFTDKERLDKMKAAFPVIDKIFEDFFEKNHYPGVAYGIVADGQLIHTSAYGVANISSNVSVTAQTD